MAVLHDYRCWEGDCTEESYDQLSDSPPSCPIHAKPMEIAYHPKGHRPFSSFTYEEDGTGRQIEVTSITQLRGIEAESRRAWEQGLGRPVVFRAFTQDSSNRDQNVFERLHPQYNRPKLITRSKSGVSFITSRQGPPIPCEE